MIFRAVEDADLIRQAARGNVESYNLLISRWEKRVYNYLLRITSNREDALDLTQDVFLKAYQNLRKLDDPARFAAWLYRIAHNEAFSMFRKRRPETDVDELEPEATETKVTVGGSSVFPMELSLAVSGALGRLSPVGGFLASANLRTATRRFSSASTPLVRSEVEKTLPVSTERSAEQRKGFFGRHGGN